MAYSLRGKLRVDAQLEAIIFDIDGTLVDSVELHAKAWQVAFEKFGKKVSFEAIRRQIGKGADQLLPVFFSKDELDQFGDELNSYRSNLFKQEYLPTVKAFPKVRALFERIKQDGKQIALASSAKDDELEAYKKIARIADLTETETSSGDVKKSKPYPDVFATALKRLGNISPDQVIAVGDTPYDAEAAGKINLRVIGLLSGGWNEEELRRAGCVAVYQDPADLLARYDSSPLAPICRVSTTESHEGRFER
jgi:HAD superfamily hydrolase (TIGR01549 family)